MKIYDCITYFDEPMLFDLRLNILDEYVDKFIVIEARHTHNGNDKKLNFEINNFKKFKNKIIYKVIENQPKDIIEINKDDDPGIQSANKRMNSLKRIELSYDTALDCLIEANPEDLFIFNDSDEIPNLEKVNFGQINNKILIFKQKMFYYKFNLYYDLIPWFGSRACAVRRLVTPTWLKYIKPKEYSILRIDSWFSKTRYNSVKIIENGGWHFCNVKSSKGIEKKLFNFGHHNEVEESGIDLEKIEEMVREKKIYYDHLADKTQQKHRIEGYELKKLDFSELPSYLIKNYETYKKWFDN
jgi:beta-1,4-mannosyl-glycoprotein beta-1,4-N-acetylglucosaminyltransferase